MADEYVAASSENVVLSVTPKGTADVTIWIVSEYYAHNERMLDARRFLSWFPDGQNRTMVYRLVCSMIQILALKRNGG